MGGVGLPTRPPARTPQDDRRSLAAPRAPTAELYCEGRTWGTCTVSPTWTFLHGDGKAGDAARGALSRGEWRCMPAGGMNHTRQRKPGTPKRATRADQSGRDASQATAFKWGAAEHTFPTRDRQATHDTRKVRVCHQRWRAGEWGHQPIANRRDRMGHTQSIRSSETRNVTLNQSSQRGGGGECRGELTSVQRSNAPKGDAVRKWTSHPKFNGPTPRRERPCAVARATKSSTVPCRARRVVYTHDRAC